MDVVCVVCVFSDLRVESSFRTPVLQLSVVAMPPSSAAATHGQSAGTDDDLGDDPKSLSAFPGEEFHTHQGRSWQEGAEAVLAGKGLLKVANGANPPAVEQIIDLELLDPLPDGHRDAERRREYNLKGEPWRP